MEMDEDYWRKRWENEDTPWHENVPDVTLVKFFSDLKPTRVLVPLCGKSVDMAWMASRGHEVIGVELSPLACESFFKEQRLPFEQREAGPFVQYSSLNPAARVTLLSGDIFKLTGADLAAPWESAKLSGSRKPLSFGALFDRAALIALPPELRLRYTEHLTGLVKARTPTNAPFFFLQFVIERSPHDTGGPPFSITEAEIRGYYEKDFKIDLLEREDAELTHPSGAHTDQCIYRLTPR
jgi:thiopurine S-methyltransferase